MNKEIELIERNIDRITIDGKTVPKTISEFDELSEFKDFENLKRNVSNKSYSLLIPNHLLYENFEYIATNSYRKITSFFKYLPFVTVIVLTIICLINNQYFGLLLLPFVFLGQYLSAFFKNFLLILGILILSIYLMFNGSILLGAILGTLSTTIISSIYFKIFRRIAFHSSAMQSEKVFSFLFYSRNISLVNNLNKMIIKSL